MILPHLDHEKYTINYFSAHHTVFDTGDLLLAERYVLRHLVHLQVTTSSAGAFSFH